MKECKVIVISFGLFSQLWDDRAKKINKELEEPLKQGYEVKSMFPVSEGIFVYLERDAR